MVEFRLQGMIVNGQIELAQRLSQSSPKVEQFISRDDYAPPQCGTMLLKAWRISSELIS